MFIKKTVNRRVKLRNHKSLTGFTLIEMLVAVSVFTVVISIALATLLNLSSTHAKTASTRNVLDNFNFAVEFMARSMRTGVNYHCGSPLSNLRTTRNCPTGDDFFAFIDQFDRLVAYRLNIDAAGRGSIERAECGVSGCALAQWIAVTAPEINVEKLRFYVRGAGTDLEQPFALIIVQGSSGIKETEKTTIYLETYVTQRIFDS